MITFNQILEFILLSSLFLIFLSIPKLFTFLFLPKFSEWIIHRHPEMIDEAYGDEIGILFKQPEISEEAILSNLQKSLDTLKIPLIESISGFFLLLTTFLSLSFDIMSSLLIIILLAATLILFVLGVSAYIELYFRYAEKINREEKKKKRSAS